MAGKLGWHDGMSKIRPCLIIFWFPESPLVKFGKMDFRLTEQQRTKNNICEAAKNDKYQIFVGIQDDGRVLSTKVHMFFANTVSGRLVFFQLIKYHFGFLEF